MSSSWHQILCGSPNQHGKQNAMINIEVYFQHLKLDNQAHLVSMDGYQVT